MELEKQKQLLQDVSESSLNKLEAAFHFLWDMQDNELAWNAEIRRMDTKDGRLCMEVNKKGKDKDRFLAQFSMEEFPNCYHVVLSTNAYVSETFRKRGYGEALHKLRVRAASLAGFTRIMATVNESNEVELAIMGKNDWRKITTFPQRHSGEGQVSLWERVL